MVWRCLLPIAAAPLADLLRRARRTLRVHGKGDATAAAGIIERVSWPGDNRKLSEASRLCFSDHFSFRSSRAILRIIVLRNAHPSLIVIRDAAEPEFLAHRCKHLILAICNDTGPHPPLRPPYRRTGWSHLYSPAKE